MHTIECTGTSYEIGFAHGTQARIQVHATISFYRSLFLETTHKPWPEILTIASQFRDPIASHFPALYEELTGLSDGAQVPLLEIVAINVRTEINFGLFSDGCTSLSLLTSDGRSFLSQNWDWMRAQKANLVLATISGEGKPVIKMVTEAGLVGKIGMNEYGVGVCLNAIRARGMSVEKVPVHLALRMVLECRSVKEAREMLGRLGVASACHILLADGNGGVGSEWSADKGAWIEVDGKGRVVHSNHYVTEELRGTDSQWLEDSGFRIERIGELCDGLEHTTMDTVQGLFKDEKNYPAAICRKQEKDCHSETFFNIVMDLTAKKAKVLLGRPSAPDEEVDISFDD